MGTILALLLRLLRLLFLLQSLPSIGSLFVGGGAGGSGTPSGDSPLRSFPLIFPQNQNKKNTFCSVCCYRIAAFSSAGLKKRKSASAGQLFFVISAAITGHLFTDGLREVALALANVNSEIEAFFWGGEMIFFSCPFQEYCMSMTICSALSFCFCCSEEDS